MRSIKGTIQATVKHHAIVGIVSYLIRRKPTGIGQSTWDQQYATGYWDHLGDLAEMPRFAMIAGYCRTIASAESVLDIGCGSGHLASWICKDKTQRYVGIDISPVAIAQARDRGLSQARFEVADATAFEPDGRFGIIVFNEILYYMNRPEAVLQHYEEFLEPDGVIIISMWRSSQALQTWRRCAHRLKVLNDVRLRVAPTSEWHIRLCRPSGA